VTVELGIELDARPLERVDADVVVAGIFQDDRPLRGGAARADWRLCGQISRLCVGNDFTAETGTAVLLPSLGQLRAARVLLLGLGRREDFRLAQAQAASVDALGRSLDLGADCIGLTPPGIASDDFPRHAQTVVSAAVEVLGLRMPDSPVRLRLSLPVREHTRAQEALAKAIKAEAREGIRVQLLGADPPLRRAPRGADRLIHSP
jgi:hypothetical protein